jgi:Tol biopolymer transport system component
MTRRPLTDATFDAVVRNWLDESAHGPAADATLDAVLARTSRTRPLPSWLLPERIIPISIADRARSVPRAVPALIVIGLLLVAAIAIAIVGSPRRLPPPFGLAANGLIAYDTGSQIFVANADGSDIRPLPDGHGGAAASPVFSPDGTQIAFWGDGSPDSLYLANSDGSGVRKLVGGIWTATPNAPSWSPDGRSIVYSTESGPDIGDEAINIVDVMSGAVRTVGPGPGIRATYPVWSPDGQWIAFQDEVDEPRLPRFWIIRPDGRDARSLPTGVPTSFPLRWAPDPTRSLLAYSAEGASIGGSDVFIFDVSTFVETTISGDPGFDLWPSWSPDAARLVWTVGTGPDDVRFVRIAPLANPADGFNLAANGMRSQPAWSPDGTRIYALDASRTTVIVVTVDGSSPILFLPHAASQALPDWQRLAP